MDSPLVTLTTDWGSRDFFEGMVKGRLYATIPSVRVVDITHGIEPFNLIYASFVVQHACLGFPPGTIHIIDVASIETVDKPFVVVEYEQQYFICQDNGIPFMSFGDEGRVVQIEMYQDSNFYTFAAYNLFCLVAAKLAQGGTLDDVGTASELGQRMSALHYLMRPNGLTAYILHIDSYGNAYLNITFAEFEKLRNKRSFEATIHTEQQVVIREVAPSYDGVNGRASHSKPIFTVSATGLLQIAIFQESAEQLLGLKVYSSIDISFR